MPAVSTSWLVGYFTVPAMSLSNFDGDDINVAAGTYCLRHSTAALSFLDVLNTAIDDSLSAITCTSLVVLQNRHIQINLSAIADLNFATGTINGDVLAAVLGFDATDHTGASSYTAENISPFLWSPGYPATPTTIAGVSGYTVPQQSRYQADDGSQLYVAHYGDQTWQELNWSHIVPSRMRVTPSVGGTYHEFFEQCTKIGRRFLHYEGITEDLSSTTAVTWTTALGPYVQREADGNWYRRNVPNAEVSSPLELPLMLVDEVS